MTQRKIVGGLLMIIDQLITLVLINIHIILIN